jgi:hypothetical protein
MIAEVERERRQLRLAVSALEAYRHRDLGLGTLISDLDALWGEFRLQDDMWLEEFRGHWWTLEQFHAVAIDRELNELPDDFQVPVDEAVDQLRFLMDSALGRVPGE